MERSPDSKGAVVVRADAQKNRDHILDVARQAMDEDGAISLNQIAQRAGVGPGTLYRHYPSREALVLAVYQFEIDRLVDSVPHLLTVSTPLEALRTWTSTLVASMRMKHGLGDALSSTARQAVTDQSYGPVMAAITQLLDAGKHDGTIRVDADPADFLLLTGALWRTPDTDQEHRVLALILDGLQPYVGSAHDGVSGRNSRDAAAAE
jgi:AcrR family transcriptional regulator